jgi:hypothetical protein
VAVVLEASVAEIPAAAERPAIGKNQ